MYKEVFQKVLSRLSHQYARIDIEYAIKNSHRYCSNSNKICSHARCANVQTVNWNSWTFECPLHLKLSEKF